MKAFPAAEKPIRSTEQEQRVADTDLLIVAAKAAQLHPVNSSFTSPVFFSFLPFYPFAHYLTPPRYVLSPLTFFALCSFLFPVTPLSSCSLSLHPFGGTVQLIMPVIGVTHTFPVCLDQIKNIVSILPTWPLLAPLNGLCSVLFCLQQIKNLSIHLFSPEAYRGLLFKLIHHGRGGWGQIMPKNSLFPKKHRSSVWHKERSSQIRSEGIQM